MGNIHLVTGYAGKQHVTSADQGVFNAAIFGDGQFVFDRGNKLAASVVTNNLIRITDGDIYMQGRHIRLNEDTYVDLAIENGAQGMLRNDLIVVRYTKDAVTGVEDANLVVIKGTAASSNQVDPAYTVGDIITGHALVNDMPLYRIPLTGLNVGTPVALFEVPGTLVLNLNETKQDRTDSLAAATALADNDYFPFYDASANAHKKTLWSNIKSVLNNLFAAKTHVAQHKTGGADALAPADIGAVKKSGDTMTGDFAVSNSNPIISVIDSDVNSQGALWQTNNQTVLSNRNVSNNKNNARSIVINNSGHANSKTELALRLYEMIDGVESWYNILHTANVPSPGNFVLGSYVGTGTKGADGKCSITFPFVPKYVVIGSVIGGTAIEATFINPLTTYNINKDTFGTFIDFYCSWSEKTLTWWLDGANNFGAGDQLNAEGATYRYIAWG